MSLALSYIGPVGIQKTTQGEFWFSTSLRKCSQLSKSYTVPFGNYLVAWRGTLNKGTAEGSIIINEDVLKVTQVSLGVSKVGGMVQVFGATTINIRGAGEASFLVDPELIFVRFG